MNEEIYTCLKTCKVHYIITWLLHNSLPTPGTYHLLGTWDPDIACSNDHENAFRDPMNGP